jgi:hypothetical protein
MPIEKIEENVKKNNGESELIASDHPEFDFKPRDGWVTYNHRDFTVSDGDKYAFHCLFYIQHREDATIDVLKKLIQRFRLEIIQGVSNDLKMDGEGAYVIVHYHPFQLSDENGNIVRCLLEFELPVVTKSSVWLKHLSNMFNWMDAFSYHEWASKSSDEVPDGVDKNMLAMRKIATSGEKIMVVPGGIAVS